MVLRNFLIHCSKSSQLTCVFCVGDVHLINSEQVQNFLSSCVYGLILDFYSRYSQLVVAILINLDGFRVMQLVTLLIYGLLSLLFRLH